MALHYFAHVDKLESAIDSTCKSRSAICLAGQLSPPVLRNALNGKRITVTKANAIVKGLKESGADASLEREDLFFPESESD